MSCASRGHNRVYGVSLPSSKAVRREPGHGLFDQFGDIRAVSRDDGLLLQTLAEIDVLGLRNGVFQIVIVIRKAGVRLDLADAPSLQDGADGDAVLQQAVMILSCHRK